MPLTFDDALMEIYEPQIRSQAEYIAGDNEALREWARTAPIADVAAGLVAAIEDHV